MDRGRLRCVILGALMLGTPVCIGGDAAWGQAASTATAPLYSTLQTIGTGEKDGRAVVIYRARGYFEAPNWSRDGRTLIFDQDGGIKRVPANVGEAPESVVPETIDVGAATRCSGSHGLSPDGKLLAISCSMAGVTGRQVFVVSSSGGTPRMVTAHGTCNFHSWSPDGKTILFTRQGNIYAIAVEGGEERALTSGTSVSDDPDYSADGRWIYFNSDRGVGMQIWRMRPDGSEAEAMTNDDRVNWTPHPSPDGKTVVYQSYEKGTVGHPANKNIELRIMELSDHKVRILAAIVGGTGTMNVSSWAPDSRHLAFVSYELAPAEKE
jgi:TolB protein